ncbi:MAG TPA: hypothetical protein VNZ86_20360, partial [Bacteroidia bacterium]|nr:hypothetical protein [Bacteroidia bacterium]
MFWSTPKLPVSPDGQQWIEDSLVWTREQYGEEFLKNVAVITPSTKYFDRKLEGSEADAQYVLGKVCEYMQVDPNLMKLTFYGKDGVVLKDNLLHPVSVAEIPAGTDPEKPGAHTEICLDLKDMKDPLLLMVTLIREVAQVKLLHEKRIVERIDGAGDMLAVAFGFGIFLGNGFAKISEWEGNHSKRWSLNRQMNMPEPFIAYAMAWMVHYQGDQECLWTKFLNKTMADDFKACIEFIAKYPAKIRMERRPEMKDDWRTTVSEEKEEGPVAIVAPLPEQAEEISLPEITGMWSGNLIFGSAYGKLEGKERLFNLELELSEDEELQGTATDTGGFAMNPSGATVAGFTDDIQISFTLQYQTLLLIAENGTTLE